jgi:capsular exopolysaccharide synthesis family protein
MVVISVLLVVGSALVSSFLQTPVYEAAAEVRLQQRQESLFNAQTGQANDPERLVQTEIRAMKSQPVRAAVTEKLGVTPKVSVSPVGQTDDILVKGESTVPEQAAAYANAYANAYLEFRRRQAVDELLAASGEVQRKVAELQKEIDATDPKATQRRDSLLQQQALFKQRLDQLQVDSALKTGGAQLVTAAAAPTSPVSPKPLRSVGLALVVGLVFGTGIAFVTEHVDDSIRSKEDLDRVTPELPTLATIPGVRHWKERQGAMIVSLAEPKSPVSEAYRSLRTALQFIRLDRALRTIQVTSPGAGDGKTTTLANLAVALAQAGERVVVVSCDLRRPRIHEFFRLSNDVGFTSVLLGNTPLSGGLKTVDGQELLTVLPSGPIPPNPSELLTTQRAVEVLVALQTEADVVLVDCPPVLPVTDAAVLSSRVDATLLVARAGHTTRHDYARAHDLLKQVDAPFIGTVLNGAPTSGAYGYSYRYNYSYAHAAPSRGPRGWALRRNGVRAKS